MRQRQHLFLNITRIILLLYIPFSISLGIYYLFTGNIFYSFLSFLTPFWLCLPQTLPRMLKIRHGYVLLFFYYLFITISYSGGYVLSLNKFSSVYGVSAHFITGLFLCMLSLTGLLFYSKQKLTKQNYWLSSIFSASCAISITLLLEIVTILLNLLLHYPTVRPIMILCNLSAAIFGAVVFCILTFLSVFKHIHTYPLYAFEDFLSLNVKSSVTILPE